MSALGWQGSPVSESVAPNADGPNADAPSAESQLWRARFGSALAGLDDGPDIAAPAELWAAIDSQLGAPVLSRRREEGEWFPLGPGATMKMLMCDPPTGNRTALLRLEPGTVFPTHEHDMLEECLMLEGETIVDGVTLRAGDYVIAQASTTHHEIPSPKGALLLLRWAA